MSARDLPADRQEAVNKLLPEMMRMAVWLQVERMKARGGPTPDDFKKAQETSDMLGERGDVLLCGGGKPGECAELFNHTAHAYAVLAFVPGGVNVFGTQFEARLPSSSPHQPATD